MSPFSRDAAVVVLAGLTVQTSFASGVQMVFLVLACLPTYFYKIRLYLHYAERRCQTRHVCVINMMWAFGLLQKSKGSSPTLNAPSVIMFVDNFLGSHASSTNE